jgi:hypothetical protein
MKRYERITIRPEGGRARTGWYEVIAEGPKLLLLRPVDAEGEDRSHYNAEGTLVDVQELVSVGLVVRRLPARMNPHYGCLEVIQEEQ